MIFNENKNIKIYNGDVIETINNYIKEQEIDIVVTSPPYNLGKKYSSYNDKIPINNYINWMNDFGIGSAIYHSHLIEGVFAG